MLYTLAGIAVFLTIAMYATKKSELGFACTLWWFIFSGHCYTLFTTAWVDIEYYMFFGSAGMAIFTMLGAFALREKKDTIADEEMDEEGKGESSYVDENEETDKKIDTMFGHNSGEGEQSQRSIDLHERSKKRREKNLKKETM